MSQLYCIAYLSTCVEPFSTEEIEALLFKCRAFNSGVGVTGALLLHNRTFFQYFEGPQEGLKQVEKRIKDSTRHTNITVLLDAPVDQRLFSKWLMGFANAPESLVLLLEQAEWRREVGSQTARRSHKLGLDLLIEFWGKATV
jgi:hypothetical protein